MEAVADASTCDEPLGISSYQVTKRRRFHRLVRPQVLRPAT
jgi:hypothetical protein